MAADLVTFENGFGTLRSVRVDSIGKLTGSFRKSIDHRPKFSLTHDVPPKV